MRNQKPYEERTDLEQLQSQWTKLSGLNSREEWSAAVVRAATAAEIATNFAVRREFALRGEEDIVLVDSLLKWANGLAGKLDRLLLPLFGGKERRNELRKLRDSQQLQDPQDASRLEKLEALEGLTGLAHRINKERNSIVHGGQFRDEVDATEVVRLTREFVERLVGLYETGFKLIDKD